MSRVCVSLHPLHQPTRAEQEAALQKLREEYESLQKSERERAEETKKCALEKIKLEVEEAQQRERMGLEQEKERVLNEIKERLERERKEVRLMVLLPAVPAQSHVLPAVPAWPVW